MAGKLVQDESGQIFYQAAGGVLQPITEAQAEAFDENQDAGENFIRSANLAITNLGTGAASLLSDDPKWKELNRLGREEAQALQLAQPMIGGAGSLAPQVAAGVATAGFGPAATGVMEAGLGAASTPESPVQGALIGGGLGVAGALAPKALGWGYQQGQEALGKFGLRGSASQLDEAAIPGYVRPGDGAAAGLEQAPDAAAAGAPPSPGAVSSPYTNLADDMSAQGAMRPLQASASDAVGDLPLQQPQRMADRVVASIEREAAPSELAPMRVAGDMMTPDELAQVGVTLNPGQFNYLTATTAHPGAASAARELMAQESARTSWPGIGAPIRRNLAGQQEAATGFITRELDLPPGIALTDGTVSEVMAGIGNRMDQIADQMGGVRVTQGMRDELAEIMRLSSGKHTRLLQESIDNTLKKAENNNGVLTGHDWQILRTDLQKQMVKGTKGGKIDWVDEASDINDVFANALEAKLPSETQRELQKLRKQYAIGATLSKVGTRNKDGMVNPTSFYSNWKRPQSMKFRGKDDVGRFMNTMDFLTSKRTPDSGTAGRLMEAGAGIAADMVPGGNLAKRIVSP